MYDFGAHRQWPLTLHFKLRKLHFHVTHTHTSSLSLNVSQVLEIASFVCSLTSLSSLQLLLSEQWTRSYNLSKSNADIIVWAFPKSNSMVTHPAQFSSVSNVSHSLSLLYEVVLGALQKWTCVCNWSTKKAVKKQQRKRTKNWNIPKIAGLYVQLTWISEHTNSYSLSNLDSHSRSIYAFFSRRYFDVFSVCVCVYLLC